MDRRDFLKLIGVASGTSVLAGCDLERKSEKLIPYLVPPEDGLIPGDAAYKPSTCTECPAGCGISVTIKDGKPTKLEGLVSHPVNDGSLCLRGQASLSRLYHPDRIRQPMIRDESGNLVAASWADAYKKITDALAAGGENLFLSQRTSGSLSRLIDEFCRRSDVTRLPEFELYSHSAVREANRQLFGRDAVPSYRFDKADFILTLGADVIGTWLNPVKYGAQIAKVQLGDHFNWYHAEPVFTLTGATATHRMSLNPGSEAYLLACMLGELRTRRIFTDRRAESHLSAIPNVTVDEASTATGLSPADIEQLLNDFLSAHDPLVIADGVAVGYASGVEVAKMASLLQYATGMIGKTVDFTNVHDFATVGGFSETNTLAEKLKTGGVGVLFVSGVDPVARLSGTLDFDKSLGMAALSVGVDVVLSDTMKKCDVVLPASHALESWGDSVTGEGVVSSIQPAIEPLFDSRSTGDILLQIIAASGGGSTGAAEDYQSWILNNWSRRYGVPGTRALVADGYLRRSRPAERVSLAGRRTQYPLPATPGKPVLLITPSLRFFDGRSRDLLLLNEIPDPLTSITWDKWVSIAGETAKTLGVEDGDRVEIATAGWSLELPVKVQPGMGAGVFMVDAGTTPALPGGEVFAANLTVRKISGTGHMSILAGSNRTETQGHVPLELVPHHGHGHSERREDITFFPLPNYPDYRWAMAIDLDKCTGCSACVAACYVENNIPVVGRDEHLKGREMSWLAIQPYYSIEDDSVELMPMLCQHCDNAPCEPVCPVFATYHNDEGLNAQVYNRCVGTRYCANNCPYKVRRFNWFDNTSPPEPLEKMFNPDVSVRNKGIMEKCSFCVQRIRKARDVAKDEDRKIGADEVVPACAQTCPAEAITFGNIKDENSRVARLVKSENSHQALAELGTGPAVYYLKRKGKVNDHHG
jgi:anaerobic selenocysteine-containing dehydrogenase/Fe-S-cluster-containing dehydrogenase component